MDKTCYAGGLPIYPQSCPGQAFQEVNCGGKSLSILRCKVDVKSGLSYGCSRGDPGEIQG